MSRWLLPVLLAGCGRLDFEARSDALGTGDLGDIGDGSGAPFCALHAQATFCDDFESGSLMRWDGSVLDKGTAMASASAAHEGTSGLVASVGPLASGQPGSAYIYRQIGPANGTAVTLSFDVRADGGDAGVYPVFAAIGFNDATTSHRTEYVYTLPPGLANIEEAVNPGTGTTYSYYTFTPPSPSVWHRVRMAMTITHIDLRVDDAPTLSQDLAGNTGGQAYIELGMPYLYGPAVSWTSSFDNVLVD